MTMNHPCISKTGVDATSESHGILALCRAVAFFQPLDLHLEPADLLVKLGLDRLALVVVAAASVAEQRSNAIQVLLLPLADLDRVDLKGA